MKTRNVELTYWLLFHERMIQKKPSMVGAVAVGDGWV